MRLWLISTILLACPIAQTAPTPDNPSLFSRLKQLFTGKRTVEEPMTLRRWESAKTHRLNAEQWKDARGASINSDLQLSLETLRARAAYEVANNPTLEGMINGYANDFAGANGPLLQVQSDNPEFDKALEYAWSIWWGSNIIVPGQPRFRPDIRGKLSGVDFLKSMVRSLWINGEFLWQFVDTDPQSGFRLRLRDIHPRRLATPADKYGDPSTVMGVKRDDEGVPIAYYITTASGAPKEIAASSIVHGFFAHEPDQARGVPLLATVLQSAADLRDYDLQVMDAARAAANNAIALYTDHEDAKYVAVNESTTLERGTMSTMPPGWKPMMLQSTQPMSNYAEFRAEKQRDFGRPGNMPLMLVRQDSSNHNYSSARFDGEGFRVSIEGLRGFSENIVLSDTVERVRQEGTLGAAAGKQEFAGLAKPPRNYQIKFVWPAMPRVDQYKEVQAIGEKLRLGLITYGEALAEEGKDEDQTIAERKRTNEKLKDAGLPPLPTASESTGPSPAQMQTAAALRQQASAAEEAGDQETADQLNAQADELEKSTPNGHGGDRTANAGLPVILNGAQITAMVDVVKKLGDGSLVPEACEELLTAGGMSGKGADRIVKSTPKVVVDINAESMAFQRGVVNAFLADGTTADVIYNATNIPELLKNAGLPIDPAVIANPENTIPFLPVQDSQGNPVTGETLKEGGVIVGGVAEQIAHVEQQGADKEEDDASDPKP